MSDIMTLFRLLHWVLGHVLTYINEIILEIFHQGPIPRHVAFIMDGNRRYAKEKSVTVAVDTQPVLVRLNWLVISNICEMFLSEKN